ncbi:MoaD/ThiS family protein [Altererythrobacter sp. ZODW24]|uniref:MoaD/ThiS family protein n=1 Tax=Altererythrobacter sp. ZODW24 TaxID=2185142 RepID=UPI000DF7771C|nr:MoaD/ThiS family protein [Altererythrobacter sp. ZODW24]
MAIRILFLGPLADLAGEQEREVAGPLDWDGLLALAGPEVAEELQMDRVNVACAGKVLADKTMLAAADGDEIALLPPVSGG